MQKSKLSPQMRDPASAGQFKIKNLTRNTSDGGRQVPPSGTRHDSSEVDVIKDKLREVIDPELNINIVDLGFIYDVKIKNSNVMVVMTLTSPGCPLAGEIEEQVKEKVGEIKGIKKVNLEITFEPLWTPDKMSEETRTRLGV